MDKPAAGAVECGMTIRTSPWPAGVPCWADLTSPDMDATKRFYGAVLGWSFQQFGPEYGGYAIAEMRGVAAAGVGPAQGDSPVVWTLYFASDDADATAEAVTAAGGTIVVPVGDVGPMGRMFIAADPTGAAFGVWQAGQHIGAGIANEPGGLMWEDLRSSDPAAARAFYSAVFAFTTTPLEMPGDDYHTFQLPQEQAPLGGMGSLVGMQDMPSHWLVYFAVADTDAAATAAVETGGSVVVPAFDTEFGRLAGFSDPGGAFFMVIQPPAGAPMPDRAG